MNPPSEHCSIEIRIPKDPRGLGAVRGALEHTARHLGFPQEEEEQLASAIESILHGGLDKLNSDEEVFVRIQEHPGLIEIELTRPASQGREWVSLRRLPGIDRVEQETSAGETRIKMIKRVPGEAHAPHGDD